MEDIFGTPKQKTPVEEAWHTEQERKKYDIIRVCNPTNEDFYVMYDVNQHQKVPKNSTIDVPRYIAIRYVNHMNEYIVHAKCQKMHDDFIEERRKKGLPEYVDKATENNETYMTQSYPKANDPAVIAQNMDVLWVGLVYEFGRDKLPEGINPRSGEVDQKSPLTKAIETMGNRRVDTGSNPLSQVQATPYVPQSRPQPASAPTPSPFATMNEKLSSADITNE